jgi:hypothetical protein
MKVSIKMKAVTTVELRSLKSGEVFSFPGETDFYIKLTIGDFTITPGAAANGKILVAEVNTGYLYLLRMTTPVVHQANAFLCIAGEK